MTSGSDSDHEDSNSESSSEDGAEDEGVWGVRGEPDYAAMSEVAHKLEAFISDKETGGALARSRKEGALRIHGFLCERRDAGEMLHLRDVVAILAYRRRIGWMSNDPGPYRPLVMIIYPELTYGSACVIANAVEDVRDRDLAGARTKIGSAGGLDKMYRNAAARRRAGAAKFPTQTRVKPRRPSPS